MLADNAYNLAADPTKPHANPTCLANVPKFDFAALDQAVATLKQSAKAYDDALAAKGNALCRPKIARACWADARWTLIALCCRKRACPAAQWYKNLIYAPGRFTGYGAKTMPGIREAIEEERSADATKYIGLTAGVLKAYSAQLDKATGLMRE